MPATKSAERTSQRNEAGEEKKKQSIFTVRIFEKCKKWKKKKTVVDSDGNFYS